MLKFYHKYKNDFIRGLKNPVLFYVFFKKRFLRILNKKNKKNKFYFIRNFNFSKIKNNIEEKITIIVPIYNAYEETLECIDSVKKNTKRGTYKLILIDDKSSDERVKKYLATLENDGEIRVVYNDENMGFVKTANKGMQNSSGDIVLLNSDTKVTKNWLRKMTIAAYSSDKIGTVTPFSNAAGAFSVPETGVNKDLPLSLDLEDMSLIVERNSLLKYPEVPTGNGFCMFIKRSLVNDIGFFDEEKFGMGYGEENDFCMRAKKKGWKNIIDDSTFIYHKRSASFSNKKDELIKNNRKTLEKLHPSYGKEVKEFVNSNEIKKIKIRIKEGIKKFLDNYKTGVKKRILYVIHEGGNGGVINTNNDLIGDVEKNEYEVFVLTSDTKSFRLYCYSNSKSLLIKEWQLKKTWDVKDFYVEEYSNIYFSILFNLKIDIVHIRHLFKHSFDVVDVCEFLKIPKILSFHDFYYICPSIHLITKDGSYCGGECLKCENKECRIPTSLIDIDDKLQNWTVDVWRSQVKEILEKTDAFITTSLFAKEQYEETYQFLKKKKFFIIEHGRDFSYKNDYIGGKNDEKIKILVPGNIDFHKGSKFIIDLLDFDKESLIEIHCIGSIDDSLKDDNRIFYHGKYQREQFYDLVKKIKPNFIGIFSICPETFCHTLTEAWSCGMPVVVTNIGALKERVEKNGGGIIVDREDVQTAYSKIISFKADNNRYEILLKEVSEIKHRKTFEMSLEYLKIYKLLLSKKSHINLINVLTKESSGSFTPSTHIRVISPVISNKLIKKNSVIFHNKNLDNFFYKEDVNSNKFIFIQRDAVDYNAINKIKKLKDDYGYKIIFEIDDDILAINETHPEYELYKEKIPTIKEFAKISDIIISTNENILDKFNYDDKKKIVIPNYIDERIWFKNDYKKKISKDNVVRIGYIGSFTHDSDIEMINFILPKVIKEVKEEHNINIKFFLIGGTNKKISFAETIDIPQSSREYPFFVEWCLMNINLDIGIAPLDLKNPLNYGKSSLKYLEYSVMGVPAIYSDIPAYKDVIRNGENGFLIEKNDIETWVSKLKELVVDKELREKISKNAREGVIDNYLLKNNTFKWNKVFQENARK